MCIFFYIVLFSVFFFLHFYFTHFASFFVPINNPIKTSSKYLESVPQKQQSGSSNSADRTPSVGTKSDKQSELQTAAATSEHEVQVSKDQRKSTPFESNSSEEMDVSLMSVDSSSGASSPAFSHSLSGNDSMATLKGVCLEPRLMKR